MQKSPLIIRADNNDPATILRTLDIGAEGDLASYFGDGALFERAFEEGLEISLRIAKDRVLIRARDQYLVVNIQEVESRKITC